MKKALYLDDQRIPTDTIPGYHPWDVVINYKEFTEYIIKNGIPNFISFDHDLADEHMKDFVTQMINNGFCHPSYTDYQEKTGLDCAKWLVEFCQKNNVPLPLCCVHSFNPVGARNIQSFLNGYHRHTDQQETCFIGQHKFIDRSTK